MIDFFCQDIMILFFTGGKDIGIEGNNPEKKKYQALQRGTSTP